MRGVVAEPYFTLGPMSAGTPMWLQVLQGLLTPTIAVVATYIAWQQWKTNEIKLRLDRYERRLAIYREVMTIISSVVREAKCSIPELLLFRSKTFEAEFLFGADIPQYIEEVFQRGLKLHTANAQYRDISQPPLPGTHIVPRQDLPEHNELIA